MVSVAVDETGAQYEMVEVNDHATEVPGSKLQIRSRDTPEMNWSSLNFTAGKSKILTDCWGQVKPGQVCAIMGPSGAGKSSLLNVLAGRSTPGKGINIEGKITVGGKVINPVEFRKNIAYVMQEDALMATATPREALTFSANMRLSGSVSQEETKKIVDHWLEELDLVSCADELIGNKLIKGISGGRRKRTSVGVELITSPYLLFLDEPTTGLDSYSAFTLVRLLRKVSASATILCTIHQPSSEVFFLFDMVIFLKQGRVIYHGAIPDMVGHFSKYDFHCPANYNPADYVMTLSQIVPVADFAAKDMFLPAPAYLVDDAYAHNQLDSVQVEFKSERSFFKQVTALTYRELISTQRDIAALIGRFGVTLILNLIFGLIFLGAGNRDDSDNDNFTSHFGAVTMVFIANMFGAAQPVMLSFPFERPMFLREYSTGTYGAPAYFLSKLFIEAPLAFLQTLEAFILCYFMIGMNGNFILIVLSAWGLSMASSSAALCLGCSVSDVKTVTELAPMIFVPQMLFAGFFIRTSLIPIFLRWAQYLCSLKYAMNLVILTEFSPSLKQCNHSAAAEANCKGLIHSNQIDEENYWIYIILLFVIFAAFRFLGMGILIQKAKKFY